MRISYEMKMEKERKRNGKIEFMRFLFCVLIIFFHIEKHLKIEPVQIGNIQVTFFHYGYIGVEFFFLVSGYLMGKSIYKKHSERQKGKVIDLGTETFNFMKHKYLSIFPYHVIAFIPLFVEQAIEKKWISVELVKKILEVLPSFFLIQKAGFNYNNLNSMEWYISAMLIALFIIYPICRKYYSMFVHVIGPLLGILILGYFSYTEGTFVGASKWTGLGFVCVWRAIAEISIGIVCFEIARVLSDRQVQKKQRVIATIVEVLSYLFVFMFAIFAPTKKLEFHCVILLAICVVLSFSGISYGEKLADHKLVYFLGKFSLPLYLNQLFAIFVVKFYFRNQRLRVQILITVIIVTVMAFVTVAVKKMIQRYREKRKQAVS